jgi:2-dehydro-3-deoxyphosphogluconate aldolase / (4S)-4-hydroxy-2-oxoglutarate aldolase
VVLRAERPALELAPQLGQLAALGVRHVEIAWGPSPAWIPDCRRLIEAYPDLRLGAASICTPAALAAALEAGFSYGVSPVLEAELLETAAMARFALVPGVMTPTEVNRARSLGCPIVKLFPAVQRRHRPLAAPAGSPWPTAPLLHRRRRSGPGDVEDPWLEAGVDAVALGSVAGGPGAGPLRQVLADLPPRP